MLLDKLMTDKLHTHTHTQEAPIGPHPQYGWDFPEEIPEEIPETLSERFLEFP